MTSYRNQTRSTYHMSYVMQSSIFYMSKVYILSSGEKINPMRRIFSKLLHMTNSGDHVYIVLYMHIVTYCITILSMNELFSSRVFCNRGGRWQTNCGWGMGWSKRSRHKLRTMKWKYKGNLFLKRCAQSFPSESERMEKGESWPRGGPKAIDF